MTLFALPFGRCLSPQPYRAQSALKKGDRVVWNLDFEQGGVTSVTEHALSIDWDESGVKVYPCTSGALEHIVAIGLDGEGDE
jgi:hypothetical protein